MPQFCIGDALPCFFHAPSTYSLARAEPVTCAGQTVSGADRGGGANSWADGHRNHASPGHICNPLREVFYTRRRKTQGGPYK